MINNLAIGGAETMLHKLVAAIPKEQCESSVFSLVDHGEIGRQLQRCGVPVEALGCERSIVSGAKLPWAVNRLAARLKVYRPDVVQGWMYHSNLLASLAAQRAGLNCPVFWNIRNSALDHHMKLATRFTGKVAAWMSSRWPAKVIINSESGREFHTKFGYDAQKIQVIPNSFDCDVFRPDDEAKLALRRELGISSQAVVLGMAGRFHVQKGFAHFIAAAGRLACEFPQAHFVLAGRDVDAGNRTLQRMVSATGCGDRFRLLGERCDMPRVMAAWDFGVSASTLEGFPNVVGEAMATGLPCLVTDVGDSARIVADTGVVVPPGNVSALVAGGRRLLEMASAQRRSLGMRGRRRIQSEYTTERVVSMYREVWHTNRHTPLWQSLVSKPCLLPSAG